MTSSRKRPVEPENPKNEGNKKAKIIWELFDQGFTVPFLARYRKELTGNMSAEELRIDFQEYEMNKEVESKALKLIGKLEKSGQLNPHLRQSIKMASTLEDVETLAAPFKSSSTTQSLANKAKNIPGLQKIADDILQQNPDCEIPRDPEKRLQVGYIISDDLLHRPEITELIATRFSNDRRIHITSKR